MKYQNLYINVYVKAPFIYVNCVQCDFIELDSSMMDFILNFIANFFSIYIVKLSFKKSSSKLFRSFLLIIFIMENFLSVVC